MRCRDVCRLLVTEEVPGYGPPPRGAIRRHLDRCEVCREEAGRLDREARVLRRAFLSLPIRPDFTDGVWARIDGDGAPDQKPMP